MSYVILFIFSYIHDYFLNHTFIYFICVLCYLDELGGRRLGLKTLC